MAYWGSRRICGVKGGGDAEECDKPSAKREIPDGGINQATSRHDVRHQGEQETGQAQLELVRRPLPVGLGLHLLAPDVLVGRFDPLEKKIDVFRSINSYQSEKVGDMGPEHSPRNGFQVIRQNTGYDKVPE